MTPAPVTRACFIHGSSSAVRFPQGLKPLDLSAHFGTIEVVPCYKAIDRLTIWSVDPRHYLPILL